MSPSKRDRHRVAVTHPVTDSRGRSYGPGDEISDLDVKGSEYDAGLVESGAVVKIQPAKKPATKKQESDK